MTRRRFLLHVIGAGVGLASAWPVPGHAAQGSPTGAGRVTGTALGTPSSAVREAAPLTGMAVVLVPKSEALLAGLERIKQRSRDSMAAHRSAIPEMRQLVETSLQTDRGARTVGPPLAATVDAAGRFEVGDVPGGAWILIGHRVVYVERGGKDKRKETGTYQAQPRLVGYERVTVWLQVVTVEPGRQHTVELTDRNAWFEGVEEKMALRERPAVPTPNRRSAD